MREISSTSLDQRQPSHLSASLCICSCAQGLLTVCAKASVPENSSMAAPVLEGKPIPEVDILFLGSPGVGKATFLS